MKANEKKFNAGITIGDLNGIGPEVIIKCAADNRVFNHMNLIVYGSTKAISYHKNALNMRDFKFNGVTDLQKLHPGQLNVVNCWQDAPKIELGKYSPEIGALAKRSIDVALEDMAGGKLDFLVTAPLNKVSLNPDGGKISGHTELISEYFGKGESIMMMINDYLKVGLVTNHLALKDVSATITKPLLETKLGLLHESLKRDFLVNRPKIAVLSLNPHAGENGELGREEQEIINPVIKKARDRNWLVSGAYAADGFFGTKQYEAFDGILAMYHDQGLIPFKTLAFDDGCNYTAGLSIVRTSPDHGPAYDIAGKNLASAESMRCALFQALDIVRNREEFDRMRANPLKKRRLKKEYHN